MRLKQFGIYGLGFALVGVAQPLWTPSPTEAQEQARQPLAFRSAPVPVMAASTPHPRPVPKVRASRPAPPVDAPSPPPGFVYWKTIQAKVTAYDPTDRCCGEDAHGRTSIGDDAWVMDGVAADPKAIPYRTRLWMPGVGWREVDDTGSAMKRAWRRGQYQVDLRVPYYGQARRWGVRHMALHLYRPAK